MTPSATNEAMQNSILPLSVGAGVRHGAWTSALPARTVIAALESHLVCAPLDLAAHVERIRLARACGDARELASALVDLFSALGGRGRSLKRHLVALHRGELASSGLLAHVEACAEDGERPDVVAGSSRLPVVIAWPQHTGRPVVHARRDDAAEAVSSPSDLAREMLREGQIELAFDYFEEAFAADPHDDVLLAEAIELCVKAGDAARYEKLREIRVERGGRGLPTWASVSRGTQT